MIYDNNKNLIFYSKHFFPNDKKILKLYANPKISILHLGRNQNSYLPDVLDLFIVYKIIFFKTEPFVCTLENYGRSRRVGNCHLKIVRYVPPSFHIF